MDLRAFKRVVRYRISHSLNGRWVFTLNELTEQKRPISIEARIVDILNNPSITFSSILEGELKRA